MINSITNYIKGSSEELSKVVWPTKQQAIKLTIIVLVFCVVSALFFGVVDYVFNLIYDLIIKSNVNV
ncbi:MAG: preprotein translocase subunit SecE [Patescibacteria group bacterium]